ncbi:MAG TPA: transglycosylase SLT domain-containing protein [Terrimesophilobacter sp.]|nr:transglycosylase SLT domain-containing protein [Terrimesophilobacter sp.]
MGRHLDVVLSRPRTLGAGAVLPARRRGFRYSLPLFSFVTSLAIVLVTVIAPTSTAQAEAVPTSIPTETAQQFVHAGNPTPAVVRDGYRVSMKPTAPAVGKPDPGSAQAVAYGLVLAKGWDEGQYSCLVALWQRESHWNTFAMNPTSGAYGIPQALPGSKMASAGADWATNPATQITWGIGYIQARYGTPCGAWDHSEQNNWY